MEKQVINDDLKNLGIDGIDTLKSYLESIKDLDQNLIREELKKMGITDSQIDEFYKMISK